MENSWDELLLPQANRWPTWGWHLLKLIQRLLAAPRPHLTWPLATSWTTTVIKCLPKHNQWQGDPPACCASILQWKASTSSFLGGSQACSENLVSLYGDSQSNRTVWALWCQRLSGLPGVLGCLKTKDMVCLGLIVPETKWTTEECLGALRAVHSKAQGIKWYQGSKQDRIHTRHVI